MSSTKATPHNHPNQQQQHHHQQQQQQQNHQHDDTKKNTERNKKISQYSRDIHNVGHSHFSHSHAHSHSDKESQKTKHDGSDGQHKVERHRRISHHSRDGGGKGHHTGRPRAGSKKEHDRHSVATSGDLHPPIEYENTFKLEPDSVFQPAKVTEIIKQVLHENLNGKKYINGMMGDTCVSLSDVIKERVRQLNLPRFKIVSTVMIGERRSQSMQVSSRCLWNQASDNFASCVYNKGNLCAVGMVFAVYQE